jgi:hypothetical protein
MVFQVVSSFEVFQIMFYVFLILIIYVACSAHIILLGFTIVISSLFGEECKLLNCR